MSSLETRKVKWKRLKKLKTERKIKRTEISTHIELGYQCLQQQQTQICKFIHIVKSSRSGSRRNENRIQPKTKEKSERDWTAGTEVGHVPVVWEDSIGQDEPPFLVAFEVVGPLEQPTAFDQITRLRFNHFRAGHFFSCCTTHHQLVNLSIF